MTGLALFAALASAGPADGAWGFAEVIERALSMNPSHRQEVLSWETAQDTARLAPIDFTVRPTMDLRATQAEGDVRDEDLDLAASLDTLRLGEFSLAASLEHCKYMPLGTTCSDPENYSSSITLTWSYDLFRDQDPRIRGAALRRSAWAFQEAALDYFAGRQDTVSQAVQRFLSLRRQVRNLEIRAQSVEDNERALAQTRLLNDLGLVAEREVGQARLRVEESRLDLLFAEEGVESAWESLNRFLDLPLSARFPLAGDPLPVPEGIPALDDWVAGRRLLDRSVRADLSLARTEQSLLEARDALRWPVTLSVSGGGFGDGRDPDEAIFHGHHTDASASLTVEVPLDRRRERIALDNTERSWESAKITRAAADDDFLRELQASHRAIRQARAALVISAAQLASAEENYAAQELAYQQGVTDLDTLQNAQRSLVNAQVGLTQAEDNLATAWLDWWRLTDDDLAGRYLPEVTT